MKRMAFESEFLYGLHEPGGEWLMAKEGIRGWILFTEAIGHDPNNRNGGGYTRWSNQGYGIISRLNNGYHPSGTIPHSSRYKDFAKRCANFVSVTSGCHIWIIGNETNYAIERPSLDGVEETITPQLYSRCYSLCRSAIKSVVGHENDMVIVSPVAPWNAETRYPGNQSGDWVKYFADILETLGPNGCDGFALHTYTHSSNPGQVHDAVMMDPPFQNRHYNFRAYRDFMNAVPKNMRHLPCYITETDQDVAWENRNTQWVQRAYGEIDHWNKQPGNQTIRSLILYRWPKVPGDRWWIEGKAGVHDDFSEALKQKYKWYKEDEMPSNTVVQGTLNEALIKEAAANQVIRFSPSAAIQKAIFADDFVPNSNEFSYTYNGVDYVAQRAEHMQTGNVRVYYAVLGAWNNVKHTGEIDSEGPIRIAKPFVGNFRISQGWGENPQNYARFFCGGKPMLGHNGVDFATPVGTPIVAVDDGAVARAAFDKGGFGEFVVVSHSWGESWYAHLSKTGVKVGDRVRRGEQLGESGNTGNSTGPHLHFGIKINPWSWGDGFCGYSDPLPVIDPVELA